MSSQISFKDSVWVSTMSGYFFYRLLLKSGSKESINSLCALYEKKYDNWLDEKIHIFECNNPITVPYNEAKDLMDGLKGDQTMSVSMFAMIDSDMQKHTDENNPPLALAIPEGFWK